MANVMSTHQVVAAILQVQRSVLHPTNIRMSGESTCLRLLYNRNFQWIFLAPDICSVRVEQQIRV
eukprot:TRINITY_DN3224_c0_g1_i1.p1 TRINITY_DN3224_c0_g1~~TRINITY_DN3224_c0_g1_i1.p1  ORF type:complete len:76 (+),score=4.51 TRINITY_DN3224_c0_g1_i1:35-229(+)